MSLTKRQVATLRLIADEGGDHSYVDEGTIVSELWPVVVRVRPIANALVRLGLVTYGCWNDDGGYELHLTDAGHAALSEAGP